MSRQTSIASNESYQFVELLIFESSLGGHVPHLPAIYSEIQGETIDHGVDHSTCGFDFNLIDGLKRLFISS
jgi:hypothetical protein